ncbi:protein TMED8 isoform X1 [Chiroxiphia lanceolata]|uniref:protein TMED8 isoform X1 n=1 Tax=Chiroxiphia lanceolata TaxID=296741 RepID=UPI0013CEB2D0|nr:protein TMED8 isoform X1 [Chiroxiphia lanceolata]
MVTATSRRRTPFSLPPPPPRCQPATPPAPHGSAELDADWLRCRGGRLRNEHQGATISLLPGSHAPARVFPPPRSGVSAGPAAAVRLRSGDSAVPPSRAYVGRGFRRRRVPLRAPGRRHRVPGPRRSQIGSHLSAGTTEDSKEEADTLEDREVAELEEKLPDKIHSLKKEAGVWVTNYHVTQGVGDIVMIQSDHTGAVDILSAELETADLLGEQRKAQPPPLAAPTMWTTEKMKEFKAKMGKEKNGRMVVKRGEVVTVRVPTHPDGKCICWEFATDDYDIGFGVYFDWTTVTNTAITVQVSESSDEEDEEEDEEIEGLSPAGDVERGSKSYLRNRYGEIMPVYRRNSHREVQAGSHEYPGEGIYLLKFDNSYSLLRNKTLFFHVYYMS